MYTGLNASKVQFGMRCVLLKVAIGLNIAELIQERINSKLELNVSVLLG